MSGASVALGDPGLEGEEEEVLDIGLETGGEKEREKEEGKIVYAVNGFFFLVL